MDLYLVIKPKLYDFLKQAYIAAEGTVQISLMREYWDVYVSLTLTNGRDVEIGEGPGM